MHSVGSSLGRLKKKAGAGRYQKVLFLLTEINQARNDSGTLESS